MPMFYTPKPRQFHYAPRFYNPETEDWDNLKKKYGLDDNQLQDKVGSADATNQSAVDVETAENADLEYFKKRVRDIEREKKQSEQKLGLADLFRKRERPQFHYVSRFDNEGNLIESPNAAKSQSAVKPRIKRRFDEDEMDRFKPIPASKIIIYTLLVCLLLYFIFSSNLF